ncbi:alpha-2-macroglobulin family protein [Neolewinella sp.]|uniref:alpha-2-macroglobulin family protein n=1 Tax=Neolewinella sp. TaxID=2993543 RepID=UPI003B51E9A6
MHYLLALLLLTLTTALMAQTDPADYAKFKAYVEAGKYQSALAVADSIYARAARSGQSDELLRALGERVTLTQLLAEDEQEAALGVLREALSNHGQDPVVAALTHLMLGEVYFNYAQQNQYRLSQGTELAGQEVSDSLPLADHTLQQLLTAGRDHLYRSLALSREQQTRLAEIPALIVGGQTRRDELPTLYDLLVGRAMELLSNSLGSLTDDRPVDAAELLVPAGDFCDLDLTLRYDLTRATPRKLLLYQQWIAYHLAEITPALLYADLERLRYVHQLGAADSLYLSALEQAYEHYAALPQHDRFLVEMARLLDRDDASLGERPRVRALTLIDRVGEEDEVARVEAVQLRASITAASLSSQTHTYYPRGEHLLVHLTYRNVEQVYYRLYRYDPAQPGDYVRDITERLATIQRGELAGSGSQRLVPNDDYSQHTTELDLAALPTGGYYLVVTDGEDFDPQSGAFTVSDFQVTDLSTLKISSETGSPVQVVDRTTGAAVPDVRVEVYRSNRRNQDYRLIYTRRSGEDGVFTLPTPKDYAQYRLVLSQAPTGDRLVTDLYTYNNRSGQPSTQTYTTLLTDRPLYRPGQRVHVYGLQYRTGVDQLPSILPEATVTVILRDANYQEVAQQQAVTDAYGRFSVDFELPEGGLTGEFSIQTDNGNAAIRVEEYKRPRFEVTLEAPEDAVPRRPVTVTGEALTYAGPPVADARVSYRVYLEEVHWYFYRGYGGGGGGERELIASGETTTGERGNFELTFTSPTSLSTAGYPSYRYVIETDVADQTGETHTATATVGIRGKRPAVVVTADQETLDRGDSLIVRAQSERRDTTLAIELRVTPVIKPNASLLERDWPVPDRPVIERDSFADHFPYLSYAPVPELTEWPTNGNPVYQTTVTLREGTASFSLPADFSIGHYRIDWRYADGTAGAPATFSVYNSATAELPAGRLYQFTDVPDSVRVDEPVELILISALDLPLVLSRWESRSGLLLERDSTTARSLTLRYTPTEADRGGLFHQLAFVRLNRVFQESRQLPLPWENKELHVTYATFRSKLRPGTPEEWTLELKSSDSLPAAAAALATMYDASLDQLYAGRGWQFSPYPVYGGSESLVANFSFGSEFGQTFTISRSRSSDTIPDLPYLRLSSLDDRSLTTMLQGKVMGVSVRSRGAMRMASPEMEEAAFADNEAAPQAVSASIAPAAPAPPPEPPVQLRTNLQETAFWLPNLTAGPDGSLRVTFTSPEALTAWKFRFFAHDKALNYVISQREVVTQKELMVLPNVPRFLREGDRMELTAKVSNLTDRPLDVRVELELFNPDGSEVVSVEGSGPSQSLQLADSSSATVRFPISVPDGASLGGPLGYRIIARSDDFSDGEENVVPVLSDRTLITVSQPFYLRRGETKEVTLPGLLPSSPVSPSLIPLSYTLQATTNPAWLALKALPYLMEYPYDCTEQLANRYFANQLAYQTVSTKPVLEEVFNQWETDSTALLSELEKNQDLKTALVTETPWVREAQSEAEQRARIGELFQLRRLAREQEQTLAKLAARQESDGAYGWFPGGPSDRYMTQYVVETIARMQQLGVIDPAQRATVEQITSAALRYLDRKLEEDYQRLLAETKDSTELRQDYRPTPLQLHYLYARTLINGAPAPTSKAFDFYRERAFSEWLSYGLYEQALIAITMAHSPSAGGGRGEVILASLRERAIHKDEFGMYWKYDRGYSWNELPIETHTRLLEAFRTIDPRPEELDEMRLYLLTNKRTTAWPTTKATAAAVYAILNAGESFTVDQPTQPIVASWPGRIGDRLSTRVLALQETAEAATGEFTLRVPAEEVSSDLTTATIKNPGNDLVWGGVFWQYTELADRVEASHTGPLSLERSLYKKVGDQLQPIMEDTPLHPGDRITVRLTLRSDRAMDYVHVKDRRAATFEPVDALSGYQYRNGIGYYFAPGDLATNFFIDHLPRGTYTLEYDLFATYTGSFSSGLGRVECMYAPEFGGNTSGNRISVE